MPQTRLTHLSGRNVLTFKKLDVTLENQGLVWIRGRNGAGKSAMFDLIRHILLGKMARGLKGAGIVRAGSRNGMLGTLVLEKDNQQVTLLQSHKHKKYGSSLHVYKGTALTEDNLISHQRAAVRTQKEISDKYLGMTDTQVEAGFIISQKTNHPLVGGSGEACAAYLSNTFGLDCYDDMRAKLKKLIDDAERQMGEADAMQRVLDGARLRSHELGGGTALLAEIEEIKELQKALKAETKTLNLNITQHREAIKASKERERLVSELGELAETKPADLCDERDALDGQLQSINEKLAAAKQAVKQKTFRDELSAEIKELAGQLFKGKGFTALTEDLERALGAVAGNEKIVEANVGPASMLAKLQDLDGVTECPCCGQAVDAKHISAEIKKATQAASDLKQARLGVAAAKIDVTVTQKALATFERRAADHKRLKEQLLALPEVIDDPAELEKLNRRKTKLNDRINALNEASVLAKKLEKLEALSPTLVLKYTDELKVMAVRLEEIDERMHEASQKLGSIQSKLEEIERVTEQMIDLETRLSAIAVIRRENELRKTLRRALARLKVRKLHGIVQAIEKALPPYVSTLFDDDSIVEVDDKDPESIERWVSRPNPDDPTQRIRIPVMGLSLGEGSKLSIAFIWALRKLVQPERTVNILVLDEADRGLEEKSLEAYGALLEQLKEEYESIFVISHRKELSGVKFDHVWTVEKTDGVSKLITDS